MAAIFRGTWVRCFAPSCPNASTIEHQYVVGPVPDPLADRVTFYACPLHANEIPADIDLLAHTFTCYPERDVVAKVTKCGGVTLKLDCGHWGPSPRCTKPHAAASV